MIIDFKKNGNLTAMISPFRIQIISVYGSTGTKNVQQSFTILLQDVLAKWLTTSFNSLRSIKFINFINIAIR